MGGFNNTMKVDLSDMEVFDALNTDTVQLQKPIPVESLADDSYGRRIPDLTRNLHQNLSKGPPILPPQLVHVILNKDTPLNWLV